MLPRWQCQPYYLHSLLTMWFLTTNHNNHAKIASHNVYYDFRTFWDILSFWNIVFQISLGGKKVPQLPNIFITSGLKNVPNKNNTANRSVRLDKNNTDVLDYSAQGHIYYSCSTTAKCYTKKKNNNNNHVVNKHVSGLSSPFFYWNFQLQNIAIKKSTAIIIISSFCIAFYKVDLKLL